MLMVVFEFPYGITSGCFDVVDAGRHQFVNYPINQNIAVCGRQDCFYPLLGQCSFVIIGKLAAKVNVKSESAIVVNGFYPVKCSVIMICPAHFHYGRFTVLNHTINDFIESCATVGSFTIERLAVDPVYQFLELQFVKFFGSMGRIFAPSPILFPNYITIQISPIGIQ